jgi:hypothetical protein
MTALRIPQRHESGLAKLVALKDESVEELISALQSAPPKLLPGDLSVELVSEVRTIPPDDLRDVMGALISLCRTGLRHQLQPKELAEELLGAMRRRDLEGLRLSPEQEASFRDRLVRLLGVDSLVIVAKALGVLRNNDNMFCSARVLTDIRPVFGSDPEATPAAAVIVHTLNLTFHHEDRLKDFYIAMDTGDIQTLRKVLDRAELKANSLKLALQKAGITYLDAE